MKKKNKNQRAQRKTFHQNLSGSLTAMKNQKKKILNQFFSKSFKINYIKFKVKKKQNKNDISIEVTVAVNSDIRFLVLYIHRKKSS